MRSGAEVRFQTKPSRTYVGHLLGEEAILPTSKRNVGEMWLNREKTKEKEKRYSQEKTVAEGRELTGLMGGEEKGGKRC